MTWSFVIIALILSVTVTWIYNRLVRNRNIVNEAWAGIDVQLQKRAELVPNLVKTVKAYATHESSVFEDVNRARRTLETGVDGRARQETAQTRSLGRLFALAEEYPA